MKSSLRITYRTVEDILEKEDPPSTAEDASIKEKMSHRLKTKVGKNKYKKRKETVEPVFGIIKSVMRYQTDKLPGFH